MRGLKGLEESVTGAAGKLDSLALVSFAALAVAAVALVIALTRG